MPPKRSKRADTGLSKDSTGNNLVQPLMQDGYDVDDALSIGSRQGDVVTSLGGTPIPHHEFGGRLASGQLTRADSKVSGVGAGARRPSGTYPSSRSVSGVVLSEDDIVPSAALTAARPRTPFYETKFCVPRTIIAALVGSIVGGLVLGVSTWVSQTVRSKEDAELSSLDKPLNAAALGAGIGGFVAVGLYWSIRACWRRCGAGDASATVVNEVSRDGGRANSVRSNDDLEAGRPGFSLPLKRSGSALPPNAAVPTNGASSQRVSGRTSSTGARAGAPRIGSQAYAMRSFGLGQPSQSSVVGAPKF